VPGPATPAAGSPDFVGRIVWVKVQRSKQAQSVSVTASRQILQVRERKARTEHLVAIEVNIKTPALTLIL
jgi:hypothetical protein